VLSESLFHNLLVFEMSASRAPEVGFFFFFFFKKKKKKKKKKSKKKKSEGGGGGGGGGDRYIFETILNLVN